MLPVWVSDSHQECNNSQLRNTERKDTRAETCKCIENSTMILLVGEQSEVTPVASFHGCYRQPQHDVAAKLCYQKYQYARTDENSERKHLPRRL